MSLEDIRDHYVVCAYGRVGRSVTRELEAEGLPFVVIEPDEAMHTRMHSDGVLHVAGDPTTELVLARAGVHRARGLISAVDSDADGVFITLTARSMNAGLFIVARAAEPQTPELLRRAGADRVVSPYVSSGAHMAMLALRPRVVDYLEVPAEDGSALRFEQQLIEEGSPLVGLSLAEVATAGRPLLLRRAGGAVLSPPDPAIGLQAGDLIVMLEKRMER